MVCAFVGPVAAGVDETHVVPLLVRILPEVPGATTCKAEVPLPSNTLLAVRLDAPVPPLATPRVPVTPVDMGNPVAFVSVPLDGVPKAPPLMTGDPAVPMFVPSAVATPVPKPDTSVEMGRPVALVSVPLVGVPKAPE